VNSSTVEAVQGYIDSDEYEGQVLSNADEFLDSVHYVADRKGRVLANMAERDPFFRLVLGCAAKLANIS
jgi:hypothetical protein